MQPKEYPVWKSVLEAKRKSNYAVHDQCWCCADQSGDRVWIQLDTTVWNMHKACIPLVQASNDPGYKYHWKIIPYSSLEIKIKKITI